MEKQPKGLPSVKRSTSAHRHRRRNSDAVERVVQKDQQQPEPANNAYRQTDQGRHDNHRDAEDPNDLSYAKKAVIKIKKYCESNNREFQHDQPEAARQQESC